MNAAFLLMSSALVAGADHPAAAPAAAAPVVQVAPCGGCAAPCDPCGRLGLFDRLRSWGHGHDCGCAGPVNCKPIFHGFTTACGSCDPCGVERCGWGSGPGLLSRLRSKFGHGCCDAPCGGCAVPGCALPPVPGGAAPAAPGAPPEKMPAPPKKEAGRSALVVPGLAPLAASKSPF